MSTTFTFCGNSRGLQVFKIENKRDKKGWFIKVYMLLWYSCKVHSVNNIGAPLRTCWWGERYCEVDVSQESYTASIHMAVHRGCLKCFPNHYRKQESTVAPKVPHDHNQPNIWRSECLNKTSLVSGLAQVLCPEASLTIFWQFGYPLTVNIRFQLFSLLWIFHRNPNLTRVDKIGTHEIK